MLSFQISKKWIFEFKKNENGLKFFNIDFFYVRSFHLLNWR